MYKLGLYNIWLLTKGDLFDDINAGWLQTTSFYADNWSSIYKLIKLPVPFDKRSALVVWIGFSKLRTEWLLIIWLLIWGSYYLVLLVINLSLWLETYTASPLIKSKAANELFAFRTSSLGSWHSNWSGLVVP